MPYEASFEKSVPIKSPAIYINDCCIGGDVIMERLLPEVKRRFEDVWSNQEDWGWFIWFKRDSVELAINIFTDDAKAGKFRLHLSSQRKRLWLFRKVVDSPELEEVKSLVENGLSGWEVSQCSCKRVDENYLPMGGDA